MKPTDRVPDADPNPNNVPSAAEQLNRDCHCETLDVNALQYELQSDRETQDLYRAIHAERPNLFSATPVFIAPDELAAMRAIIAAVESVIELPAYRAAVFAHAPKIARFTPAARGVFLGYDFHIGEQGPRLIEINSNAGGALLNTVLARTQQTCCAEVGPVAGKATLELEFFAMFMREWRLARGEQPLHRIAIVDSAPDAQYLQPEFALFKRLFTAHGIDTHIVDPAALSARDDALWLGDARVDLIYNRLTDFALQDPAHAHLRAAYIGDHAVLTPHPQAHALYADKRNLVFLSDATTLTAWGVAPADIATLTAGIAHTFRLDAKPLPTWWQERRQWFFKPAGGYGSKAVYRGDKLTRTVWDEIATGEYVVQELVKPSERRARGGDRPVDYKLDWRNYVYAGEVQLVAARLYQGQTTNFRTPGGGFAPVFLPRDTAIARCPLAATK